MMKFRPITDISAAEWLTAMALSEPDIPDVVIVEGSWWRAQRTEWRLSYLTDVRELNFPDIYWGRWRDKKVAFCCAYGAPRTVEVIHLFGAIGARLAVQIGTCGGLQPYLRSGDVILPEVAFSREGVAHLYGATDAEKSSPDWTTRARALLAERGITVHHGPHVTWSSLFTETADMMYVWHRAGYLSVDMETATTLAVANHFDMLALSLLVIWDDLIRGKRFLDPLTDVEQAALDLGNQAVYEVALALAEQL